MSERERSTKQSVKQRVKRGERKTAKELVLARYPDAFACFVGLSLKFHIKGEPFVNKYISGVFSRERDAWSDAASRLSAGRKGGRK